MNRLVKHTLVMVGIAALSAASVRASTEGSDTAGNYATWLNGSNLGTGFGSWTFATSDTSGHFLGSSTNLSPSLPDINTGGQSFGMYAANPGFATATRPFDGGTLALGQSFSIDLAVNFRNGFKGIDLLDGVTTIFNFNIGGDDYSVTAATGGGSIGNAYSDNTKFHLEFTQLTLGGGSWTITRTGGVADLDSGTYSGAASGFRLYIGNTDGGSANDLYANNPTISPVPEPSTIALVGVGLIGMWFVRRRKA